MTPRDPCGSATLLPGGDKETHNQAKPNHRVMTTSQNQNRDPLHADPLHGVTLERMLNELVDDFGWEKMGQCIAIRCFTSDPSVASSLKFLRKTPWAREKVEAMYLFMLRERARRERAQSKQVK